MIVAVNVENFRISVGFFEEDSDTLVTKFQVATDLRKTADEYCSLFCSIMKERQISLRDCNHAILSSVVPQLTETMKDTVLAMTGTVPLVVGPGLKTGFSLKIDTPSEVGGDLVADVAAVLRHMKTEGKQSSAVILHLGTVSTVSAITRNREFIGCSIFPGIRMSMEMLHGKTAQLPSVGVANIEKIIGKNSQDAVRSGVIFGHAMMLDGFVERFSKEMKCSPADVLCYVTGEEEKYLNGICKTKYIYCENLTLQGLYALFCNSIKE